MSGRAVVRKIAALSRSKPPLTAGLGLSKSSGGQLAWNLNSNIICPGVPVLQGQMTWFSDKSNNNTNDDRIKQDTEPESGTTNATGEEGNVDSSAESDTVGRKLEELEAKVKELNDRLLRSLAEQDNTRRIARRDVEEARQFAVKSFAKSMLDVADNLERALKAVPEALQKDKEAHPVLVTLYEGIEMTEKGLSKTFEENQLVKYGTVGELFDPNKHSALFEYTDPEKTPGTVGQVIKAGFYLNNRVLRPAEVGVVKKV